MGRNATPCAIYVALKRDVLARATGTTIVDSMRHSFCFLLLSSCIFSIAACVGDTPVGAGDGGDHDAASGTDAPTDTGGQTDASPDALVDAGPSITGAFESSLLMASMTTAEAVAIDKNGDVVIVGAIDGAVAINGQTYTSQDRDVLVIRFAANNGIKWVKVLGGPQTEDGAGVALDANGDVYIVGDFNGGGTAGVTASFGSKTLVSAHTGYNSFAAKLDGVSGNTDWAVSFDGTNSLGLCRGVAAGPSSVVATCFVSGELSFKKSDNTTGTRTAGTQDIWVAELDPATGGVSYGLLVTGLAFDNVTSGSVAIDSQNALFLGGATMSSSLTGDTTPFTINRSGTNGSTSDAFVVKLGAGNPRTFVWSKVYGAGTFTTAVGGLALAPDGSLYVGGTFSGTRDFGAGPVTAAGGFDQFLLHLDAAGKTLQQTTFGGTGAMIYANGVAVDDIGHPIVASRYGGTGFTLASMALPDSPAPNLSSIVTKFSPDLSSVEYTQLTAALSVDGGSGGGVLHSAIATNPVTGQSVVVGTLVTTADLGDGKTVTSSGGMYVIRRKR